MFTVTVRATNKVIDNLTDPEEALLAEAAGFRVEAHGAADVRALAALRIEQSPDYNTAPSEDEEWVRYTTKSGRLMICEVIRMTAPDDEGYPTLLELVNPSRRETSFLAQASSCRPLDLSTISPALADALRKGDPTDPGEGEPAHRRIRHGLRA
jgi:hypothetical protein